MKNLFISMALASTFSAAFGMESLEENLAETEKNADRYNFYIMCRVPVHRYHQEQKIQFFGRIFFFQPAYWELYKKKLDIRIPIGKSLLDAILLTNEGKFWCFKYTDTNEGLPAEWLKFYKDRYPQPPYQWQ